MKKIYCDLCGKEVKQRANFEERKQDEDKETWAKMVINFPNYKPPETIASYDICFDCAEKIKKVMEKCPNTLRYIIYMDYPEHAPALLSGYMRNSHS